MSAFWQVAVDLNDAAEGAFWASVWRSVQDFVGKPGACRGRVVLALRWISSSEFLVWASSTVCRLVCSAHGLTTAGLADQFAADG